MVNPPAAEEGELRADPPGGDPGEPFAALINKCGPGKPTPLEAGGVLKNGNLQVALGSDGSLTFTNIDSKKTLFTAHASAFTTSTTKGFMAANLTLAAGDTSEKIFGLGQGNWTKEGGCASGGTQYVVPYERNGQMLKLQQRKVSNELLCFGASHCTSDFRFTSSM
jgi:hypothetical protein